MPEYNHPVSPEPYHRVHRYGPESSAGLEEASETGVAVELWLPMKARQTHIRYSYKNCHVYDTPNHPSSQVRINYLGRRLMSPPVFGLALDTVSVEKQMQVVLT